MPVPSPCQPAGQAARLGDMRSLRFGVVLLVVAASLTGAGLAGATTPACQTWNQVEPTTGVLVSVAALPVCEEWAVGSIQQTLTLHLFGPAWTQVPSPDPGGPNRTNSLNGVAATSASNAWAVGNYSNGTAFRTLIAHWDGAFWTRVASPNPGGRTRFNGLFGVAARSTGDAW